MACVLSLAVYIAFAMASGVSDAQANTLLSLQTPLWYQQAEECCNHKLSLRDEDKHLYDLELFRQCMEYIPKSPYVECEPDLCYAVKKGYSAADGAINREILQLLMEVELDNNRETLNKILTHCVYGDLSKYPMGLCQLKRLNFCIAVYIQDEVLRGCDDWKEHLYCYKMRLEVTRNVKKYL